MAALRSTSLPASTAPLSMDAKAASSSFLEVLTTKSSQPGQTSWQSPTADSTSGANEEVTHQNRQSQINTNSEDQAQAENSQTTAAAVSQKSTLVAGQLQNDANASGSNDGVRTGGRNEKQQRCCSASMNDSDPSTVASAQPVQTTALPGSTVASAQPMTTTSSPEATVAPTQSTQTIALPEVTAASAHLMQATAATGATVATMQPMQTIGMPEWITQARTAVSTSQRETNDEKNVAIEGSNNHVSSAAHTESKSEEQPRTPAAKTDSEAPGNKTGANPKSGTGTESGSTDGTQLTTPEGVPVATPLDSMLLGGFGQAATGDTGAVASNAPLTSNLSGSDLSKVSGTTTSGAAATNSTTQSSTVPSGTAAPNLQNILPAQQTQTDDGKSVGGTPKVADTGAAQVQAGGANTAIGEGAGPRARMSATAEGARANERTIQPDAAENATSSGINTARVIQKMSETEMQVGMRSAEFGDISIRTSVSQQQVTTQISLDHGELSKAISAHIPAMQEKMGNEYGRSAVVEVNHSGMAFSGERGPSQHQEQRPFIHSDYVGSSEDSTSPDYPALATVPAVADGYRLDIRA